MCECGGGLSAHQYEAYPMITGRAGAGVAGAVHPGCGERVDAGKACWDRGSRCRFADGVMVLLVSSMHCVRRDDKGHNVIGMV